MRSTPPCDGRAAACAALTTPRATLRRYEHQDVDTIKKSVQEVINNMAKLTAKRAAVSPKTAAPKKVPKKPQGPWTGRDAAPAAGSAAGGGDASPDTERDAPAARRGHRRSTER